MEKFATALKEELENDSGSEAYFSIVHGLGLSKLASIPVEIEKDGQKVEGSLLDVLPQECIEKLCGLDPMTGETYLEQLALSDLHSLSELEHIVEETMPGEVQEKLAAGIGEALRKALAALKAGATEVGQVPRAALEAYRSVRGAGLGRLEALGRTGLAIPGALSTPGKIVGGAGALTLAGVPTAAIIAAQPDTAVEKIRKRLGL